jgi:ABC-type multidrug transport system ATPase subunit
MSTETEVRPRVYLDKVHLKGFKSIEDLTIDFKKGLNILIGKNGAGKSNLMDLLNQVLRFKGNQKIPFRYSMITLTSDDEHKFQLELEKTLNDNKDDDLDDRIEVTEKFIVDGKVERNSSQLQESNIGRFKGKKITFRGTFRTIMVRLGYRFMYPLYIKFDLPSKLECLVTPGILEIDLESPFTVWNTPNSLNFIGSIFSNFEMAYDDDIDEIKAIQKKDIRKHLQIPKAILENIKIYTPIEEIRFNSAVNLYKDEKEVIIDNIKIDFKINENWLPWSQLSDGTKRLFYIISEVTISKGLILLEEPELGIHPHQFNLLMDFLKEQAEEKQIIISTHSPKALDHLSPEELDHILIAYYDLDKGTQIRHLSDKEIKKAQRYMKEVGYFSDYWMYSDLE